MRYFNFEPSFKLRWYRAQDLLGSQIPVTTGGFELRISCIRSSYLTHLALSPSGLGNYFICKRFAVQTLLWSLEFAIQINLEHDTIAVRYFFLLKCTFLLKFSTKIHWSTRLAASEVFICLHNQLSFFNSIILQMSEKRDSSNKQ